MPASLAPTPTGWVRRQPERSVLHNAVRRHAASFAAWVEERGGRDLPGYVRRELDGYLRCGILGYGFVRLYCRTCRDDFVVAFSCKGRAFCPSCGVRRMVESAARWVDRLFPVVPFRQWVLSLPFELRPRLAWDSDLLSAILRIFQAEVARQLGMLAAARGYIVVAHGAASVIQPFGSALNLNIHIHSLVPDGVWVAGPDGAPRWEPLRLADHDVLQVVARIASEVTALLKKRGLVDDEGELTSTEVDEDQQLELALGQASARLRVATGRPEGAGRRAPRSGKARRARDSEEPCPGGAAPDARRGMGNGLARKSADEP